MLNSSNTVPSAETLAVVVPRIIDAAARTLRLDCTSVRIDSSMDTTLLLVDSSLVSPRPIERHLDGTMTITGSTTAPVYSNEHMGHLQLLQGGIARREPPHWDAFQQAGSSLAVSALPLVALILNNGLTGSTR